MAEVLTDSSPYEVVRDAMPGYQEAKAALEAVQRHRPQPQSGVAVDLAAEVVAAAAAGAPMPADIGRRAYEQAEAARYLEAETAVVKRAAQILQDRVSETYQAGIDAGIRALQPILAGLLDEVRALVPALNGARDAAAAVAAGPVVFTAWHRVGVLADRYQRMRGTWEQLLRDKWGTHVELSPEERAGAAGGGNVDTNRVIMVAGEMSNLDQVWPEWETALRGGDPNRLVNGFPAIADPPWPGRPRPGDLRVPYTATYLLWLATDPVVKPWLPTTAQVRAAYVAQCAAARQRQTDAEEMQRYGRVRTTAERMAAATAAQQEQIRRVTNAAAWASAEDWDAA